MHLAIAPFFGIQARVPEDSEEIAMGDQGNGAGAESGAEERFGWKMIGQGQVRGPS